MKSSSTKEDNNARKKYVFFSDPDVIVQRAETSAAAAQVKQEVESQQQQQQQDHSVKQIPKDKQSNLPVEFDLKGLQNLLFYHPVQPYPFTFISAVKRKHALDDGSETYRKTHEPNHRNTTEPVTISKSEDTQNLYKSLEKMDFVRPLKVPDLKISAKKLDFSNRENCTSKELMSLKFETPSKELIHERAEKSTKSFERVQRRLDFSTSDVSSTVNSEVEPLKVPNISISSNLSKKKEYVKENSREKENRSKRIRKDDSSLSSKQEESAQDIFKRSRSPRHSSRKDFSNNANENMLGVQLKNDRLLFHMPRESEFGLDKQKTRNFATSTVKRVNDKRHRSVNNRSLRSRDTSLESKNRSYSNESLSERSSKVPDNVTVRESKNVLENFDYRLVDDSFTQKQMNDQKHIFLLENRQIKQHKTTYQLQGKTGNVLFKEQSKRSEKIKPSTSKMDIKVYTMNSKESESIESVTDSNLSLRTQSSSTVFTQQTKNKDSEKVTQTANLCMSNKTSEDSTSKNTKKEEDSFTEATTTTKQTTNSNESNLNDSSVLLDPRRISFRDENCSQQKEFCDLITPDMNLMPRSKRQKRLVIQSSNTEADTKCSKHNVIRTEPEEEGIPLLHPTALHMQFQAELHLLDSYNESLRKVTDVEKCLHSVKQNQEKGMLLQHNQLSDQVKSHFSKAADEKNIDYVEHCNENKSHKHVSVEQTFPHTVHRTTSQTVLNENLSKITTRPLVKAVEVQTETVNDIATQTDIRSTRRSIQSRGSEIFGIPYERSFIGDSEVPQLSLDSIEQFEDLDQIEEISLSSKIRTMSEISLHETTSSIRTETGTEISISTRDVTCSFNKFLDLEIAQLLKDEKQRYDKIEMLFKSREKTLNDRTRKIARWEEQKREFKDAGQDKRIISSMKKKQRALLLKLQQEKDEMNRLKELHKIASQERKLMLQKQRNMFNPEMSTKNILTKLKRSADSQSPRRLCGPMKGYDIRSNSSMSSLVDSDKSQQDRSQMDARMQMSESELHFSKIETPKSNKFTNFVEESNASDEVLENNASQEMCPYKSERDEAKSKYEIKSRKFEDKMPRADVIRLKSHQHSVDPKLMSSHSTSIPGKYLFETKRSPDTSELLQQNVDKSISEHIKSESDTLVEELSKKSKSSKSSQTSDNHFQNVVSPRESLKATATTNSEVPEEISCVTQDTVSKTSKSSQVSEDILQTHSTKSSKRSSKSIPTDMSTKTQCSAESKSTIKRKSSKCQKCKSSSSILTENILRSKSNAQISEELIKHHNKRTKVEKEFIQHDKNDENALTDKHAKDKNFKLLTNRADDYNSNSNENSKVYENSFCSPEKSTHNFNDIKSQISNFAVSQYSSGGSEKHYSKSIVERSQDHNVKTSKNLEQVLNAREAALTSRKNCVEDWMAWHERLKTEEDHVARMEQTALKLVTASSNVFSHQDTTVSSDTSDIEGRIELLTGKLAERRIEMSRLKREARKQTKQKLRALEANLLNQIKKFDTTIHEMRKKLESKKNASKDIHKLAIESKSLADFKVPEIPLKKIQDMFKNNDLLRSRSESDLLSAKRQSTKDPTKSIDSLQVETVEGEYDRNNLERAINSYSRIIRTTEQSNSANIGIVAGSAQSLPKDNTSEHIHVDRLTSVSVSSISDDVQSEKSIPYVNRYTHETQNTQNASDAKKSSISEDVKSESTAPIGDIVTQSETIFSKHKSTIRSDLKEYKSDFDTFSEHSIKTVSSQSKAREVLDFDHDSSNIQSSNAEIKTESGNESMDMNKKVEYLSFKNQYLNNDLYALQNELKMLSEALRLQLEQKAKNMAQKEEKSTSKDISEVLPVSDKNNVVYDKEMIKEKRNKDIEVGQESLDISTNNVRLKLNDNKSIAEGVDNIISAIMPGDNKESLSRPDSQEIDYTARSKEILNEIEKSIISEHIKVSENDLSCVRVHEQIEKASSGSDIRSLSEIDSKTDHEKQISYAATEVVSEDEQDIDEDIEEISKILETRHSLESNKRSARLSEKSNSLQQYISPSTEINYSLNDELATEDHSKNESDKQLLLIESLQISSHLSISENKYHSDEHSDSKAKDSEVLSNKYEEYSNKNEISFAQIEDIEFKEVSRKSIDISETANIAEKQNQEITLDKTFDVDDGSDVHQQDVSLSAREKSKNFDGDSSLLSHLKNVQLIDNSKKSIVESNVIFDLEEVEDVSMLIPENESTNIGIFDEIHVGKTGIEVEDILDIIARENDKAQDYDDTIYSIETDDFQKAIHESVTKILDKAEKSIDENSIREKVTTHADIMINKAEITAADEEEKSFSDKLFKENKAELDGTTEDAPLKHDKIQTDSILDAEVHLGIKDDENTYHSEKFRELVITELEPGSVESESLSELEVDAKIELAEEESIEKDKLFEVNTQNKIVEEQRSLEPIIEQDSSDGEQLDNLIEIAESGLDVIEKVVESIDSITESDSLSHDKTNTKTVESQECEFQSKKDVISSAIVEVAENIVTDVSRDERNKTFDVIKDPEYEDISEESLEVSEIFDKSEPVQKSAKIVQKSSFIPERYEAIQKSEDVLKILDEITQKSDLENDAEKFQYKHKDSEQPTEISDKDSVVPSESDNKYVEDIRKTDDELSDNLENEKSRAITLEGEIRLIETITSPHEIEEKEKQEQDVLSESSEDRDTPKGVSEIEMDSPRDLNDSRLDIELLNDDLLNNPNAENQSPDSKGTFHATPIVATSEKDLQVMIDKLKASLEQPGVDDADWESKLLRIEQLQIELEIKKLEAEEVSYYVREIPNKPPPPYTPPDGGTRISAPLGSPSPPPAVIPSNLEELATITEKATITIFKAIEAGHDIMSLEAPPEICGLTKENETVKQDRRVYNAFLFDLCKETIAEIYQSEYEKPGPSWTKPNVKTKPMMKIPKTVEELNAYVNKEVATLFGFKTKLQRENMVMRWSRKRRDRVDELLAREAQAEEDEWTKFHHDELAVKNGLTVTILDTLLMETVNVVKVAYAKKRKVVL